MTILMTYTLKFRAYVINMALIFNHLAKPDAFY